MAKIARRVGGMRKESIHSISQTDAKCKRWLVACSRQFFTQKNISRNTCICTLHWPGEKGPTTEYPLKANLKPEEASHARARKRKAPKPRPEPERNKELRLEEDCENGLDVSFAIDKLEESNDYFTFTTDSSVTTVDSNISVHVHENPATGNLVADQGSQTIF